MYVCRLVMRMFFILTTSIFSPAGQSGNEFGCQDCAGICIAFTTRHACSTVSAIDIFWIWLIFWLRGREGVTMGSRDALPKCGREAVNSKVQVAARCPPCFRKCIRADCASCPRIVAGPFAGLYELPTYYSWAVDS